MSLKKMLLGFSVVLAFAFTANADSSTYTYTGNPLSNNNPANPPTFQYEPGVPACACSVDGSFTVGPSLDNYGSTSFPYGSPLVPHTYSFSVDGVTLNQSNSTIVLDLMTGSTGSVLDWFVVITAPGGISIGTQAYDVGESSDELSLSGALAAYGQGTPGTWTVTQNIAPVPEPGTLSLLAIGLFGLAKYRKSRACIPAA
jgi:hypothetical protein